MMFRCVTMCTCEKKMMLDSTHNKHSVVIFTRGMHRCQKLLMCEGSYLLAASKLTHVHVRTHIRTVNESSYCSVLTSVCLVGSCKLERNVAVRLVLRNSCQVFGCEHCQYETQMTLAKVTAHHDSALIRYPIRILTEQRLERTRHRQLVCIARVHQVLEHGIFNASIEHCSDYRFLKDE